MNVYVVYAHPNPDSLNRAILDRLCGGLEEAGHEVTVSDLYADGFDCVLNKEDLAGIEKQETAADLKPYQEKILAAQAMAFVFPIWWFGPPAILKGWFDRVLAKGFAYEFGPSGLIPKLKVKSALLLNTAGGMEPMYKNLGFSDAMNKVMVFGTLNFCGIMKVKQRVFHNVIDCGDEVRKGYLDEAFELGKSFFQA